ncbi:MAG TPA: tetratricopeptide repeat protein, partial [Gemmatimonadales bacterium]|nr:tetratricopeptide repeat protein [Gemmatimonadales bacterium]
MRFVAAGVLLLVVLAPRVAAQDIRDKYGTRSLEAAAAFEEGMKLAQRGKFNDSLAPFKKAAALDPEFQIAYYWLGYAHENLGDIRQALAAYEKLLEVSPPGRI